ncbi:hypothetical protein F5B18DRAFT_606453 [Nemania serpens]|nr:hypothetical protein F5B18DRAFT_606453 [Nemania serpens]
MALNDFLIYAELKQSALLNHSQLILLWMRHWSATPTTLPVPRSELILDNSHNPVSGSAYIRPSLGTAISTMHLMHWIKQVAVSIPFLVHEFASASLNSPKTEQLYRSYPAPRIPCPTSSKPISLIVHNWQNHTHDEVDSISFHLSTSFDDLFTRCQGDFFQRNGETPCEHRGNKYNTSFGVTNTVLLGEYVYIDHLFRCARQSHHKPIVEALAWVNIPLEELPQVATDHRYTANLKLYLNTTGLPN